MGALKMLKDMRLSLSGIAVVVLVFLVLLPVGVMAQTLSSPVPDMPSAAGCREETTGVAGSIGIETRST
jgi:hypothetical protein